MRKLFALCLIAATAAANDISWQSLQSGSVGTPLHDRGIHGEGQIIAVLDSGVDYNSCYFAEGDNAQPPINTGTPATGLQWQNIDLSRRKIIAYDFLYSCDQFPGARGCDDPRNTSAWDNQGHGTHAAASAVGDKGAPIFHDSGDAVAPAAKLIVQDAGFIGGDACSQLPGIGCPVQLTPILDQAYKQGARIHSNSWGDRQGVPPPLPPPTANYSASARDVDAFVATHPDMLVLFNTGNAGLQDVPSSTLSAPGAAKNTLQVGGTRGVRNRDDSVQAGSLEGPTRDGRIKPDVIGPAYVYAGDAQVIVGNTCGATFQPGTSWASPTIAGAAALVRQYYTEGFYPGGAKSVVNRFTPSAALLKATIIAAARPALTRLIDNVEVSATPAPSYEQGFGFPVLDDALYFAGDRSKMRVFDIPSSSGLTAGASTTLRLDVRPGTRFKAVLVWTDPPGTPAGASNSTPQLVNDLDLRVITPAGSTLHGNERLHPGEPDRLNNVEGITVDSPSAGTFAITVSANRIGSGVRQSYALVVTGDFDKEPEPAARRRSIRR
jgi:hypothetical protein